MAFPLRRMSHLGFGCKILLFLGWLSSCSCRLSVYRDGGIKLGDTMSQLCVQLPISVLSCGMRNGMVCAHGVHAEIS